MCRHIRITSNHRDFDLEDLETRMIHSRFNNKNFEPQIET